MAETNPIHVGVDGSALANPTGAAGWCWYVSSDCWAAGGWPKGSNNLGELTAVLELLRATAHVPERELVVYADSQYVIQTLDTWVHGWIRKAAKTPDGKWRTAGGQPVKNEELIRAILAAREGRVMRFVWVRGHAGHALNEGADAGALGVARAIAAGLPPPCGPGWTL